MKNNFFFALFCLSVTLTACHAPYDYRSAIRYSPNIQYKNHKMVNLSKADFLEAYAPPYEDKKIVDYSDVTHLVFNHQEDIITLLKHTEKCYNLKSILISGNYGYNFSRIFRVLSKFKNLREVKIFDAKLEKIPKGLLKLQHVEFIDLSGNQIKSLPCEIEKMSKLKELWLLDMGNIKIPSCLENSHVEIHIGSGGR